MQLNVMSMVIPIISGLHFRHLAGTWSEIVKYDLETEPDSDDNASVDISNPNGIKLTYRCLCFYY